MRPAFEILPASTGTESCTLLCEVNDEGFSFCIKDEEKNAFLGVAIYHYDKSKHPVGFPIDLQVIFHQEKILSGKFKKIKLVYSLPQSVLVPFNMYKREYDSHLMNLMHGDVQENEILLSDVVVSQSMYNCYRVSAAIYEALQTQFPHAESMHQYSLLLKGAATSEDRLSVIFYTRKIVVCLVKEDKYQLVNSYCYQTPEDVGYILLNLCRQFHIQDIHLEVGGLLEENSALYEELYKYFTDINFKEFFDGILVSDEIAKYPSHYFSHLFAIDQCE